MKWKISYYNNELISVIAALPDSILARYLKLTELMEIYGADLGMPHTRHLGNGLLELRLKGKEGIARVFYCTKMGKNIHMLHSFIKKTKNTPPKELTLARMRMREVKQNG